MKRSRDRNIAKALVASARKRAIKKGLPFDLSDHVENIDARIKIGRCELTGIAFQIGKGRHWASPAIDRIKPQNGYVLSNIRIILNGLNNALSNWGAEVLFQMVDAMRAKS